MISGSAMVGLISHQRRFDLTGFTDHVLLQGPILLWTAA